ncbi:patatin-like phospholipase family protein [Aliagarivorans marinus]|uniref:patatin-like phospholipase family protein n=1 Tax=Aliagarivorans marinus TaxID=561965 RepID=UPI00041A5290|nr:patatin-like phospholipase family protein [Aliagarivorans marinus]
MPKKNKQARVALVLTGGGARAAYQVGVLKAIAELYPRNHATPFAVLCGTSAGAINATALAVYASCFRLGVKKLEYIWRNFHCHHVFRTDMRLVVGRLSAVMFKGLRADYAGDLSFSLLDNQPLGDLLNRYLNYQRIDANIAKGYLQALAITASSYADGRSLSFYQAPAHQQDWQRHRRYGSRTQIHTSHLLASAAIPMIFPAIRVGQHFFGDGSIHQLSPLSPAIHLGADKILTIHLSQPGELDTHHLPQAPNGAKIAGHLLDSIFSDTIDSDLERLQRINRNLSLLNPKQQTSLQLRPIDNMSIRANIDFEALSHEYYCELPRSGRLLLKALGVKQDKPSALTSFIMFENGYTNRLIELGYRDACKQQAELQAFLGS